MKTTMFICQLSEPQQRYIRKKVIKHLTSEGYDKEYISECIENVISDRLVNVEEIINVNKLMEVE